MSGDTQKLTLARLRENLLDLDAQMQVEDDWDRLIALSRVRRQTMAVLWRLELREVRRG